MIALRRGFEGYSAELGGRLQTIQSLAVPGAHYDGRLLKRPPGALERNWLSRLEGVALGLSPPLGDGTPERQMGAVPTLDLVATGR